MGGCLDVAGAAEGGSWDSTRLDWWWEDELDLNLAGGSYGEKVRTPEGLEAVLRAPAGVAPTRRVWIHESVEGDARHLWEANTGHGKFAGGWETDAMDTVIILEAVKAAAAGAAGELGKELLQLLRQRFHGKPTALTVLDEYQRRPDVWEKPLQSALEETGAGVDPEVLNVTRRIATHINITQSASGKNVVQAGRDIGTLIQAEHVSLGGAVESTANLGESATIINDALQSGGTDETWVVVGARIEREDPQALWTLPEIDRLSTAAYRTTHSLNPPSTSTEIIAFWKEGSGIKRRIEFHSIGVVLAMFSWSVNPFPAAAAVLGLQAGVSLIQNQDVWEVFRATALAELTLGVVSWPDGGLSAEGFLKQTPRPVGSPMGRRFHRQYALAADTDSWFVIGSFTTLLLTEAGYRVNPAFLSQRPSVPALMMLMQHAGLALP